MREVDLLFWIAAPPRVPRLALVVLGCGCDEALKLGCDHGDLLGVVWSATERFQSRGGTISVFWPIVNNAGLSRKLDITNCDIKFAWVCQGDWRSQIVTSNLILGRFIAG